MQSERVSWPAETSHGAGTHQLFLREEELRLAQDLLFFAYRDFTASADAALEELSFGRAHHRALHFIARNPGLTVSDLLSILRITKQSLARVLGNLVDRGYVMQSPGNEDRRQRLLRLTESGEALERRLFERQKAILTAAYRESGGHAVEGFRRVLYSLAGKDARNCIDQADPAFRNRRKI
ncbi:Transcriptional regulator, MarR family [Granulibacter bethesdensis]|uniref:MarR family winged helix-turn-helix transcriptional regulator n=1 Tax=Granulibacter bethesdensis TaxID=364410 RepID=UPI00090B376C|nr:MarR family transcriptional regulator [Granulibacter bethesdensis]APH58075.1 Transcriptional regulator, MarR family [Granulibacter bethesdensis]